MDIAQARLQNQRIGTAPLTEASQVVEWLVAVQAQDYAGAKWALGVRMPGATDDEVEQAFARGSILRTHMMRPTWHFVTPMDLRWMLALTAPRVHAVNASIYRRLELDPALFMRSRAALAKALRGGRQLTRDELRDDLERAGIVAPGGQRLVYIMMSAELDGLICSGARRGKQFTYALLDERVPDSRSIDGEEALSELARRYFFSRGPATVHDFAGWSGLRIADARRGVAAVESQLEKETIDGQSYWFASGAPSRRQPTPTAHLLSIYDEYISGYRDRSAIGEAEIGARLWSNGNVLRYILILDGQIVGTCRRTLRKDSVAVELDLFTRPTSAHKRAIDLAAQRFGEFLGLPAVIAWQD